MTRISKAVPLLLFLMVLSVTGKCLAQSLPSEETMSEKRHFNLFREVWDDQKQIWIAPFHAKAGNLKWSIPLFSASGYLITREDQWSSDYNPSSTTLNVSRKISMLGAPYTTYPLAAGLYLLGKSTHRERLAETGLIGAEALINASLVNYSLKLATSRERPDTGDLDGSFWEGGDSFPSGHTMAAWSLASSIAYFHKNKPSVAIPAYGLATAISVSRITGNKHFPSDVLVGSTVGFLIGRYVAKKHLMEDHAANLEFVPAAGPGGFGLQLRW